MSKEFSIRDFMIGLLFCIFISAAGAWAFGQAVRYEFPQTEPPAKINYVERTTGAFRVEFVPQRSVTNYQTLEPEPLGWEGEIVTVPKLGLAQAPTTNTLEARVTELERQNKLLRRLLKRQDKMIEILMLQDVRIMEMIVLALECFEGNEPDSADYEKLSERIHRKMKELEAEDLADDN